MMRFDPLAHPEPLIKRVYSYAAYRLGDGPDAEDVTSETFERALRYRATYDRRKGEPISWLLGIARRCVDEAYNGRGAVGPSEIDQASSQELEEETVRRLTVQRAVLTLDERSRELVALRFGADMTARQIAEFLGERTNTVEVALHRALGRLRTLLEDDPAIVISIAENPAASL